MIETWDDLLALLRRTEVPGTTLSHDTLLRLSEIEEASSAPPAVRVLPHRTATHVLESRMRTLGVVLPVDKEDLALGEISYFWRDFFPHETLDCEGRVLAIVHNATKKVRIGNAEYPVTWIGNMPSVTMPREVIQAPPDADIPLWMRQTGCEIHYGKKAAGYVSYDRVPQPDEVLERAMEPLQQPDWKYVQNCWRRLAQTVTWTNAAGKRETRWCVPVAPLSGHVATDNFAVCSSQTAAFRAARQLLAIGLARPAGAAGEHDLSERILRIMPYWENLTDDVVSSLVVNAAASARDST